MFLPKYHSIQTKTITLLTNTYFTKDQVKFIMHIINNMPTDPNNPQQHYEIETQMVKLK